LVRGYLGDYLPFGEILSICGEDLGWGDGDSRFGCESLSSRYLW